MGSLRKYTGNFLSDSYRKVTGQSSLYKEEDGMRRVLKKRHIRYNFYGKIGIDGSFGSREFSINKKGRDAISNNDIYEREGNKRALKAYISAQQSMGKVTLAQNTITPEKPSTPITNSLNQRLYGK